MKRSDFVPGRVLGAKTTVYYGAPPHQIIKKLWRPCIIVSAIPTSKRRHGRKKLGDMKWDVIVWWLDGQFLQRLEFMSEDVEGWRVMW